MLLQKTKNYLKITAEEDWVVPHTEAIQQKLYAMMAENQKKQWILAWGEMAQIDETGIKLLIGLSKECLLRDIKLTLQAASPTIQQMVRLFKLDQCIDIKEP